MISKKDFLKKYSIPRSKWEESGLVWDELVAIHDDFVSSHQALVQQANLITGLLNQCEHVHSIKFRIKDPEHVLEKIVRKKLGSERRVISLKNYRSEISDLIGVRALHLFKDDWVNVFHFIRNKFRPAQDPFAYIRHGDDTSLYAAADCAVKEHENGYRSVHHIVAIDATQIPALAEIQVRTLFEEGWSEIDHRIRYPSNLNDPLLSAHLGVFNYLSHMADQMGLLTKSLHHELSERQKKSEALLSELERYKEESKVNEDEKERLNDLITQMRGTQAKTSFETPSGFFVASKMYSPIAPSRRCAGCRKLLTEFESLYGQTLCSQCQVDMLYRAGVLK